MKRAGDRREAVRFAPSADRVGYPLRIPRQDKPLGDLRLGVALYKQSNFLTVGVRRGVNLEIIVQIRRSLFDGFTRKYETSLECPLCRERAPFWLDSRDSP